VLETPILRPRSDSGDHTGSRLDYGGRYLKPQEGPRRERRNIGAPQHGLRMGGFSGGGALGPRTIRHYAGLPGLAGFDVEDVVAERVLAQRGRVGTEVLVEKPHGPVVVDSLAPARFTLAGPASAGSPPRRPRLRWYAGCGASRAAPRTTRRIAASSRRDGCRAVDRGGAVRLGC